MGSEPTDKLAARAAVGSPADPGLAATLEFAQRNTLGEGSPLADGFYDCGRGWGREMTAMGPAELLRLLRVGGARRGREIIVFDARADPALAAVRAARGWSRRLPVLITLRVAWPYLREV
jgi:hypothetical protein